MEGWERSTAERSPLCRPRGFSRQNPSRHELDWEVNAKALATMRRWGLRALGVICACSVGAKTAGHAGDEHTYRADGWVVKNEPSSERWWRQTSIHRLGGGAGLDLTPAGMEQAAFILLEMGQEALAQRALAAGARLAGPPAACPAAFRTGVQWTLTCDANQPARACRTRSGAAYSRREAWRMADGGRDFLRLARSMQDAVAQYCAYHDSVTSAGELQEDVRYIIYTPSFHGEGWGNRVMSLGAVAALAMGSGRILLIDWTASWPLQDYVTLPCRTTSLASLAAKHPHILNLPRLTVYDPALMSPLPPGGVPVVHYSSYSAFWGALQRSTEFAPLRALCAPAARDSGAGRGMQDGGRGGGGEEGVGGGRGEGGGEAARAGGPGEEEFRLLGCVLRGFIEPSPLVRRAMAQGNI
jgi:hypothetical protein